MKTRIYLTLAVSGIFLAQCSKETGNKGVLPKEIIPQKQLTKADLKNIAEETKKNLVTNLTQKISEKGPENALEFCNVNAIPLTKQLEDQHNVTIKRVSDKNRNPDNAANETERKYIYFFKEQLALKQKLEAKFDNGVFYAPITTNNMCLQCHGSEKDIKPETLAKIKSLYPNDNATGYQENEMRGLMVIKPN
ncbi:Tll0287-like domain-containing protein [Cloacibacterium normanense]|uniref:Tll0287-like domain-containing protein n=1 Tax=Cloacibacterium normanense TaxID=237258 RepID=UPI00352C5189